MSGGFADVSLTDELTKLLTVVLEMSDTDVDGDMSTPDTGCG